MRTGRQVRDSRDVLLEEPRRDRCDPEEHGQRQDALDEGERGETETAKRERRAVENLGQRREQLENVQGCERPGCDGDQPRQGSRWYEVGHEPDDSHAMSRLAATLATSWGQ